MGREREQGHARRRLHRNRLGSGHVPDEKDYLFPSFRKRLSSLGSIGELDMPDIKLPSRKHVKKKIENSFDLITRSSWFESQTSKVFERCDVDKSGHIDRIELWAGIMFLYHIINKLPFGGHLAPPSQKHVFRLFDHYDVDESGYLDKAEFIHLSRHLCRNVTFDIGRRLIVSVILCPLLAEAFLIYLTSAEIVDLSESYLRGIVLSFITISMYGVIPTLWIY